MYNSMFFKHHFIIVYALSIVFLGNKVKIFRYAGISASAIASIVQIALGNEKK